jgi:hypothetical protein
MRGVLVGVALSDAKVNSAGEATRTKQREVSEDSISFILEDGYQEMVQACKYL